MLFFPLLEISTHTRALLERTLEFLVEKDFIRERNTKPDPKEYYSTQFGMATVASGLAPDDALIVFDEFQKARKAFVLENELHIIYLVGKNSYVKFYLASTTTIIICIWYFIVYINYRHAALYNF